MKTSFRVSSPLLVLICVSFPVVILAQSPYTITGDLRDDAGKPFSGGATVCAIPAGGVIRVRDKICAESDASGKFVIRLTNAGTYQVTAEKASLGYMPQYVPFYRDPRGSAPPEVSVGDANPNPSVSVALVFKSGLITGKVIDEAADTPIQDFVVWLWHSRNPNTRYHEVVNGVNSPGRFKLFAPASPFQLRVEAEGYEDWVMGGGVLTSAAGSRKGPGTLMVPTGQTADFAVYMKRKNPVPVDATKDGDARRLTAPTPLSPANNSILDLLPRMTRLEWTPVEGAGSYGVEVEACLRPSSIAQSRLPDDDECINPSPHLEKIGLPNTTIEFMFRGAQPGRWRVWAIDKNGRRGSKSAWQRFVHLK